MKKIFTLIVALIVGTTVINAQSFVDAEGNEIADGATLTMNEVEEDPFGGVEVPLKGLFISGVSKGTLTVSVEEMPAGTSLACCVGTNCRNLTNAGEISISVSGGLGDIEINNTEWLTEEYGSCLAKFTIQSSGALGGGRTVYVNFVYPDPAGINSVVADTAETTCSYNTIGQRVSGNTNGIVIKNGKKYIYK